METKINWMICLLAGLLFGACSGNRPVQIQGVLEADPDIFPDYKGVTVPMNIAPLNFSYLGNEPCRSDRGGHADPGGAGAQPEAPQAGEDPVAGQPAEAVSVPYPA